MVEYGKTERSLAAQRSQQIRIFRKLETLVDYLKSLGILRFDVDAMHYEPKSSDTNKRPDRSAALKAAHHAAAYDKWLKAEIQEAIDDTSPTIPHEQVMQDVRDVIKKARAKRAAT